MIKYNLKEEEWKNHPMDNKYGVVISNSVHSSYPITIVDNQTDKHHIKGLLHLSEDVRYYQSFKLFESFLYLSFAFQEPTYRMYKYEKVNLSKDDIIKNLKKVLYLLQPRLQGQSCVAYKSNEIEDDGNYYEGYYVLNDEEEYTILKCLDEYKFYKGKKTYYPHWKTKDDLLFEGKIDFDIYKTSLKLSNLKRQIVTFTNELLDEDIEEKIKEYRDVLIELNKKLKLT